MGEGDGDFLGGTFLGSGMRRDNGFIEGVFLGSGGGRRLYLCRESLLGFRWEGANGFVGAIFLGSAAGEDDVFPALGSELDEEGVSFEDTPTFVSAGEDEEAEQGDTAGSALSWEDFANGFAVVVRGSRRDTSSHGSQPIYDHGIIYHGGQR